MKKELRKYIRPLTLKEVKGGRQLIFADFETTLFENQHYVTCISFMEPERSHHNFTLCVKPYTENYDLLGESNEIMKRFINLLFMKKTKIKQETLVYFHNLGRFDGVFLLNYLQTNPDFLSNVHITSRENVIYEIRVEKEFSRVIKGKEIRLTKIIKFRDSYLLFPQSLNNMSKIFNVSGKYDFNDINVHITNYTDEVISKLGRYCINDVRILAECMQSYYNNILDNFKIDLYQSLTLPSLAFKVYRTLYYKESIIYQSHNNLDTFVRQSYKGGVVDVYKPYLENGYYYDVNSLYPFIMSNSNMPVGKPIKVHVESSKDFDINIFFGFIKVKVKCPENLYIPFLTVKHDEYGLISPVGEWEDVYFSEEIKYAITLGYSFEYIEYYQFQKDIIFNNYVQDMYNKRLMYKESKPALANIFKLFLNSLYGRFGMENSAYKNLFLKDNNKDNKIFDKIILLHDTNVINTYKININNKTENIKFVRYNTVIKEKHLQALFESKLIDFNTFKEYSKGARKLSESINVAVHIASAITAYARIYMHKLKNQYKDHLYYSDTDSLITDIEIDPKLISNNELGLLKKEYNIKRGFFIAPKLYYIETDSGEIIKTKGIDSNLLNYEAFQKLYDEKTLEFTLSKNFIRDLASFKIKSGEQIFKLTGIFCKRKKVFNKNKKWTDTRPISL